MKALLPLIVPLVAFGVHAILNRLIRAKSQQRLSVVASLLSAALVAAASWECWPQGMITLLTALGFAYGYFHFFNITETAIRPQILKLLMQNPDVSKLAELGCYTDRARLEHRLERLEKFGALQRTSTGYALRKSVLGHLAVFFGHPWVRRVFDTNLPI